MLELKNIKKVYELGKPGDNNYQRVDALKGVSVQFRKSEFVAILGPSGCGKTTMLNIVGGLDQYSDGDLIINGISTKKFKDRDWDNYRNHRIGFVFQSYNLIPHQTVLENVELALTLSGVSKAERKRKAEEALIKVGLGDKIYAKPTQLSGGQMQRVAIARAIVNDPDIILADEPTGALDTKTSVQIMELLKEISHDKLIIMVTHNPNLAEKYSSRIIRLLDGLLTDDSLPFNEKDMPLSDISDNDESKKTQKDEKTSMSFMTALSLSGKNLLTKKARTTLVSFAGSIGIIGISLILSLSSGFQNYINNVQQDTLSTYPLTITTESVDYSAAIEEMINMGEDAYTVEEDGTVKANTVMVEIFSAVTAGSTVNRLDAFKNYIENENPEAFEDFTIKYTYDVNLNVYDEDAKLLNPMTIFTDLCAEIIYEYNDRTGNTLDPQMLMRQAGILDAEPFTEMLDNQEVLKGQYELVGLEYGSRWPSNYDEAILVVNEDYSLDDYNLYALGLAEEPSLSEIADGMVDHMVNEYEEPYEISLSPIDYEEILNTSYRLLLDTDYYVENEKGFYDDMTEDEDFIEEQVSKEGVGIDLKIVGIVRPKQDATAHSITSPVGYMPSLVSEIVRRINDSGIVKDQKANSEIDVLTGLPFPERLETADQKREAIIERINEMTHEQVQESFAMFQMMFIQAWDDEVALKAAITSYLQNKETVNDDTIEAYYELMFSTSTQQSNLAKFGAIEIDTPLTISFYCEDFDSKDRLKAEIENYNNQLEELYGEDYVDYEIRYTDYVALMITSISIIINAISYVLIAFVSVSLVVSSIMIGIITYISVLERTKEIGVLRSIGASKKDIKRVFTAESLIIGFIAGVLGIGVTLLLNIPITLIIDSLAGIPNVASLPWVGAVVLIILSCVLTFIAGLVPANVASKKDPVAALRSE